MLGKHNVSNALAAISVATLLNIDHDSLSLSFSSFKGIKRRFDIHISNKNVVYIDDYAHHPEEIKSTISGVLGAFPNRKLSVIFQPHLYSRTQDFAVEFAESLSASDELILLDNGAERRKLVNEIKLSQFNNDSGFTTNAVSYTHLTLPTILLV